MPTIGLPTNRLGTSTSVSFLYFPRVSAEERLQSTSADSTVASKQSSNRFHILRRYSWVYSRTVTSVSSACCSSFETGSLRGSELPRQPLARLVLGDALERLRLPDGVVELVQQLRLLELIRLVCGGGGLVHGLHERLVGLPGLFDRRVVSGRFVVRPVGVAAADARAASGASGNDGTTVDGDIAKITAGAISTADSGRP